MTGDVWSALGHALDPVLEHPQLAPDIEVARFRTRWGTSYAMLRNPRGDHYYRLTDEDAVLVGLFDGTRSVSEIGVERLQSDGKLRVSSVVELVRVLREQRCLKGSELDVYETVEDRIASLRQGVWARLDRLVRSKKIHVASGDRVWDAMYRWGGKLAFTWPAQVLFVAVVLFGAWAFASLALTGRYNLGRYAVVTEAWILLIFNGVATAVHDLFHALGVRHAKRRVVSTGVMLYIGVPVYYVDSTDVLMAPTRDRIRSAWYGPFSGLIIAGTVSTLVWAGVVFGSDQLLFRFALATYIVALFNPIPFLELDGYYMLQDLLDTADLRPRSASFVRYELPRRIARRQGLSAYEWALTGFAGIGALLTVWLLASLPWFWWPIVSRVAGTLWQGGAAQQILLFAVGFVVLGPLLVGYGRFLRSVWGVSRDLVGRVAFRTQNRWRREAGHLLDNLPLLEEVPEGELSELLGLISKRRFGKGRDVIRTGDRADAFFLVRRGHLAVIDVGPQGGERIIRHLGPGQAFGEIALVEGTRRTATVRALATSEVFRIDRSAFDRFIRDSLRGDSVVKTVAQMKEIKALSPFEALEPDDVSAIARAGRWVTVPPDTVVAAQGEVGDAFYAVESGQLEVSVDDQVVRTLGAGSCFGELALLGRGIRTAEVRTLTSARLFRLEKDSFHELLAGAFRRGTIPTTGRRAHWH